MSDTLKKLQQALADRYRVEREIGQGGMATVYLAHDVRHERDVAIKVLHPDLAAALGAERFLAEIKTTARLSHPHILPLLDSGAAEGFLFYVMPYVTGETLRARLERERQLPMGDALLLAREVADALGAAHQLGIIHRDVKPENILLQGGHALVADFGIALAVQSAGGARMTQTGLSLGTPQYMSPEQAMGERTIDARADQYALAAVTYEMLAGEPPFTGPTVQAIVAKALSERPVPLSTLRDTVAPSVEDSVMRGLAKLPADRFGSLAEFAAGLREDRVNSGATRAATAAVVSRGANAASRRVLLFGAALAMVGVALAGWSLQRDVEGPPLAAVQLMLDTPSGGPDLSRFGVSADGEAFVFSIGEGLMVRAPGERDYQLLSGTQGAESPSFSPDGEWIAYHTNGRVRKVAARGGSSVSLVAKDSVLAGGVHWGPDGTIVFESAGRLYLVNSDGTGLRRLGFPQNAASPRMLPDGSGIVYVDPSQRSMLMLYDMRLDTAFVLMEGASAAQYVEPGYLVFSQQDGGLYAAPFDVKRRVTTGAPVPLLTDMEVNGVVAPFIVTASGALVYRAGVLPEVQLVMREANGRLDTLGLRPSVLSAARFSPDGKSLAVTFGASRGSNRQTSILDLATGAVAQFTFEGGGHSPVWSPDGSQLAFTAELDGTDAEDVYVQELDRREAPRRVARLPQDQHTSAWPRADLLVVSDNNAPATDAGVRGNILLVDPTKTDGQPTAYLDSQWEETDLVVSPDGKWGAYSSTESGQSEIYVRAFPDARGAGQYKVSLDGGARARWGPGGRTLLYMVRSGVLHEVSVRVEPTFQVGARREVLTVLGLGSAWDVDVNTGRILFAQTVTGAMRRMVYVTDWQLLYRANAPRGGGR